jgi:CheY-like chemotaxis protein
LWPVRIDPSQVDQLLANLCVNARDAISGVGTVTLQLANQVVDAGFCADHPDATPGDYVVLVVKDTGAGMTKEVMSHLFEPFFTTKKLGQGTGLGLATIYGIVTQNGGFVQVQSAPGEGATFTLYLPRTTQTNSQAPFSEPEAPLRRGNETILFVEDEDTILRVGQRLLENLGYRVLAAAKPGDALRLAEEHAGQVQLLLTDVIMPEMNGQELAQRLLALQPDLRVVFISGYTANIIAPHGVLPDGAHFVQKPFTTRTLADMVRKALS